jgi:hypothetical protein
MREAPLVGAPAAYRVRPFAAGQSGMVTQAKWLKAKRAIFLHIRRIFANFGLP